MIIADYLKNSLIDYPGFISCVIFVPGCNFNCFYCHNRLLRDEIYNNSNNIDIFDFLQKRAGMLDGVVISGGEPTLQTDLQHFIKKIKNLGYKVKLDTNGSNPKIIKDLIAADLCDYYAVDYKAPKAKYKQICGSEADAGSVLETIQTLIDCGAEFEVRTTIYPQLCKEDLLCMSKELPTLPRYVLNRYKKPQHYLRQHKDLIEQTPYTQKEIEDLTKHIRLIQPNVRT
jgi:pyruvate formate lyase activating enzyme